jgi:hypothetical protein
VGEDVAAEQAEKLRKACRKKPFLLSSVSRKNVDDVLLRLVRVIRGEVDRETDDEDETSGDSSGWTPLD